METVEIPSLKKSAEADFAANTVVHLCIVTFPQREILVMQISGIGK